jgi:predicted metal-dependent phosphoesterase TrpH
MEGAILRIDLHTHSTHSDGVLEPEALVERAAAREVGLLALTDHDSTAGCSAAAAACAARGIRFVPGIELSASWRGQGIHIVGLGGDAGCGALIAHNARLVACRRRRLEEIGLRLERRSRLPGTALAADVIATAPVPTRQHLARALVAAGFAPDAQSAFDRYLGRGCDGHVPLEWPALADTLAVLRAARYTIVLAHPHRYRLSSGALRALLAEFAEQGGIGLEVSLPGMSGEVSDRLARLARGAGLAGSAGSDFHDPGVPWNPLGRSLKLPALIEPLAARFLPA